VSARLALGLLVMLGACQRQEQARAPDSAGAALERAAMDAGVVTDPGAVATVGVFESESDRVCLLPRQGDTRRIGASVDYGDGQRCVARGTARGKGALAVDFGGGCRFDAVLNDERITFPAIVPVACESLCEGRATLGALRAERLSDAPSEAARARAPDGRSLCAD
jgi:hypothetical protein